MELRKGLLAYIKKKEGYSSAQEMIRRLSVMAEGFCFDKSFKSPFGAVVTDGFMEQDDRYVFVYATCDEPYTERSFKLNTAYRELYEFINERMYGSVDCQIREETVTFDCYGDTVSRFDLLRVIDYMLGIAFGVLTGELSTKNIDLMYLVYNPTELDMEESAKADALSVYERLCEECNALDLSTLFTVILVYLRDIKGIGEMADEELEMLGYNFTVYLCDQELYPTLLV